MIGSNHHSTPVAKAVHQSLVGRALASSAGRLAALWVGLGRTDRTPLSLPDYSVSQLERMVQDSRMLRPLVIVVAALVRAASTASTLAWGTQTVKAVRGLPAETAVRLTGVVLVTALVTHAALRQLTPSRLRPGLPWTFDALLLVFGLVMVMASGPVVRAWTTWKHR